MWDTVAELEHDTAGGFVAARGGGAGTERVGEVFEAALQVDMDGAGAGWVERARAAVQEADEVLCVGGIQCIPPVHIPRLIGGVVPAIVGAVFKLYALAGGAQYERGVGVGDLVVGVFVRVAVLQHEAEQVDGGVLSAGKAGRLGVGKGDQLAHGRLLCATKKETSSLNLSLWRG